MVQGGFSEIAYISVTDEVNDRRDDVCWSGSGCTRWLHRSDQTFLNNISFTGQRNAGYGGVYKNMNQGADYMNHAKSAAKMAINLFEDESLNFDEELRPARKAVYVPTFFTSVPQQPLAPQVNNQGARFSRNTNNGQVRLLMSVVFLDISIFRHTIYQSSTMSTGPRPFTSPTRIVLSHTRLNNFINYLFIYFY